MLGRMAGQPVVDTFRLLGFLTLTGRGRVGRLSLTEPGERLASAFASAVDKLWTSAIGSLPKSSVCDVLVALGSLSVRSGPASKPTGFPVELIVVLDRLVAETVEGILKFTGEPSLRDGALRPLLLLADGPATATALGSELGVGAPAVNVALARTHRPGLVEWHQKSLRLTHFGERVVRRITLASDVFWLDVEQAGGAQVLGDAQVLLATLGRGFPANARL